MTAAASEGQAERVRRFYDVSTGRFRRLGQGGASIHRAVRAPGVGTRADAFHHVEEVALGLLAGVERPRVVDLGCGVGGSLLHLAARRPDLVGEGITISPAQVADAAALIDGAGLAGRVRVREADFLAPPADLADADLALAIESFVHAADADAFMRAAAGVLRPGGLLVLCDDLLEPAGVAATGDAARRLGAFRTGWRVATLVTADAARAAAAAAALDAVVDDDLTPYLELRRPRDRAIALGVRATRPLPARLRGDYWWSLAGGDALQRCLAGRLVAYRLLVFRRR